MPDTKQARSLLVLVAQDIDALEIMMDSSRAAERVVGFHAQQAAEKAFKAWLALLDVSYPMTHNLSALFALLEDRVGSDAEPFRDLVTLTPFAVQFRYEVFDGAGSGLDLGALARLTIRLTDRVSTLLNQAETR